MTSYFSKEELRQKYLEIRKNVKSPKQKSHLITEKIKNRKDYQQAKVIAFYKSFGTEVDTQELMESSFQSGKVVGLPKVVGNELKFYRISSLQEPFQKSSLGVEEPIGEEEKFLPKEMFDLIIVPGICFDKNGNRLGYGKGYYDRFLKGVSAKSIAVCFEEQILKDNFLPTSPTDVPINEIVTEVSTAEKNK